MAPAVLWQGGGDGLRARFHGRQAFRNTTSTTIAPPSPSAIGKKKGGKKREKTSTGFHGFRTLTKVSRNDRLRGVPAAEDLPRPLAHLFGIPLKSESFLYFCQGNFSLFSSDGWCFFS